MATRYTPLDNIPYPDGSVLPNVPLSFQQALNETERHTVIPVVDLNDRATKIPSPFVGMVTYNTATDAFEYWDGTRWKIVNQVAGAPTWASVSATPAVNLTPGKYYDLSMTLTVRYAMTVLTIVESHAVVSVYTNMFNNYNLNFTWDGGVTWSRGVLETYTYQSVNGAETHPLYHIGMTTLQPGTRKVTARASNPTTSNNTSSLSIQWQQILVIGLALSSGGF